jgi:hypothetical protein
MSALKSVYVIESNIGLVKLGIADKPEDRRRRLQEASGFKLKLVHATPGRSDAKDVEAAAHKLLHDKRRTGEWFDVTPCEAVSAVEEAIARVEEWRREKRRGKPGRPLIGARKEVFQVALDQEDALIVSDAAKVLRKTRSELCRAVIKGEISWAEVTRAARKAKK